MKWKHPLRKVSITPLTNDKLQAKRKGISRKDLETQLHHLKQDVSPGLGCVRNEHLLALILNPDR